MNLSDLSDKEQRIIEAYRLSQLHSDNGNAIPATACNILADGLIAVGTHCKFNKNGVAFEDYAPNGLPDYARMLIEPFLRIVSNPTMEQAADVAGYAGLFAAAILSGLPESRLAPMLNQFYDAYYVKLKEADVRSGEVNDWIDDGERIHDRANN